MSYNERDLPDPEPLPDDRPEFCCYCRKPIEPQADDWARDRREVYHLACLGNPIDNYDPPEPREPTPDESEAMAREYESWLKSGPDGY